jgi:hypothetical protein
MSAVRDVINPFLMACRGSLQRTTGESPRRGHPDDHIHYAEQARALLGNHANDGLIDTMRFRLARRLDQRDKAKLEKDPAWRKMADNAYPYRNRKTGKLRMFRWRVYVNETTGAKVIAGRKSTRVTFSPIRVLGHANNLHVDLVPIADLRRIIPEMTVDLLPWSSLTRTPWILTWVALTRNFRIQGDRDFFWPFLSMNSWTHSREKRWKGDEFLRKQHEWARKSPGPKQRLVMYDKRMEMYAHGGDGEEARGITRIESSYFGSNQTFKLAPFLPPGMDIHLIVDGKPMGFSLNYAGLHALLLSDLLGLRPHYQQTQLAKRATVRRRKLRAAETLVRSAYPNAQWQTSPGSAA